MGLDEICRGVLCWTSRGGAGGVPEGMEKFVWSEVFVGRFLY